ncbi:hypothetical protein ABEG10_38155 (plasmid) [Burkholderia cenocepacia]|uniref:hypothetical protein n=1 Tax=Burkholderia cenocepacia TaxID=95486 RepID=UPI00209D95E4|nr:hypothetical protein [Burkholderia cenocepacia]
MNSVNKSCLDCAAHPVTATSERTVIDAAAEALELAGILGGLVEGSAGDPAIIYEPDYSPVDGDVYVARAAVLLKEFARAAFANEDREVVEREARALGPSASAALERAVCDLPPLPWPAMPRGSHDYFSAGQMREYASAAISQALGFESRDADDGEVQAVPPRWYSREEIVHALVHMKYSDEIARELADWVVRHLQLAFNKGFEKGARVRRPSAHIDAGSFQSRVQPWMLECFGAEIAADCDERNHRFLEEALELVQACGCTASEAHQLVDYTFGRPPGEPMQEVGGVMVTLAGLCLANGLDMHIAGDVELTRVWRKVEQIRAKHAAKPKHSPLPIKVLTDDVHTDDLAVDRFSVELKNKLRLSREKGRSGWEVTDPTELSLMLREHVDKGDPRDVANYCMFLWCIGKPIAGVAPYHGAIATALSALDWSGMPIGAKAIVQAAIDALGHVQGPISVPADVDSTVGAASGVQTERRAS